MSQWFNHDQMDAMEEAERAKRKSTPDDRQRREIRAEAERLLKDITPGEWRLERDEHEQEISVEVMYQRDDGYEDHPSEQSVVFMAGDNPRIQNCWDLPESRANLRFIAAAPQLVRDLRDRLLTLQQENEELKEQRRSLHDQLSYRDLQASGGFPEAQQLTGQSWKARAEAAEAALSLYGQHRPECDTRKMKRFRIGAHLVEGADGELRTERTETPIDDGPRDCTCGFSASPAVGDRPQEQP